MKTKFTLLLLLLGISYLSMGQVTDAEKQLKALNADTIQGWKKGGVFSTSLAQTSLTNWSAGGQNSFAVNGFLSVFANYKRDKTVWDNSLDVGYGLQNQATQKYWVKTDDKIDFLSKFGHKAFNNFYYATLVNFKTQMSDGYNYVNDSTRDQISGFFAPAYLLGAIGLDYKPNNYLSAFIAPATGKLTIVDNQTLANAGAFGVEKAVYAEDGTLITPGEKLKSEFGGYIRMIYSRNDFKSEALKNLSFTTKVDFFSNYLENPENIDVSWETLIAMKVNKYIVVTLSTHLLYDDNIKNTKTENGVTIEEGPKVQFKEILGVGFAYKF